MASRDYEEFIAALNAHGVRYLVVGALVVAFHARPRATKDLDIFIEPTATNAAKVLAASRQTAPLNERRLLVAQFPRQKIRHQIPRLVRQARVVAFAVGHGEAVTDAVKKVPVQRLAVG